MMPNVLWVFVGGGIGAAGRYLCDGVIQRWSGGVFPLGTLVVNVLGCFAIGVLMATLQERFVGNPALRMFLTIGILGGFTTFSTFSYETIAMLREAEYFYASVNVLLTVAVCLLATYIGTAVGRLF
jgi:fluoride exporter